MSFSTHKPPPPHPVITESPRSEPKVYRWDGSRRARVPHWYWVAYREEWAWRRTFPVRLGDIVSFAPEDQRPAPLNATDVPQVSEVPADA